MTMQTDVKAKTVSGTGALSIGPCRIKGIYFTMTTAGTVAITNAGNSETITLSVPIGTQYMLLPGEGVRMPGDPTVTYTTAVGSFTVFYG